jgi:hypothetical protein
VVLALGLAATVIVTTLVTRIASKALRESAALEEPARSVEAP